MVQGIASLNTPSNPEAPTDVGGNGMSQDAVMALGKAFTNLSEQEIGELRELAGELEKMSPAQLSALQQVLTFVKSKQDQYPQAIQTLIRQGIVEPGDLPPKYVPAFFDILEAMVVDAMSKVEGQNEVGSMPSDLGSSSGREGFAKGGLASLKSSASRVAMAGRRGDTVVAHLSPKSAALLKSAGGSGTTNPKTGLKEYGLFSSIGNFFKKAAGIILPVALNFAFPGLGTIASGAIGAGLGALINGASPGDALKSALLGGAGGALVGGVGSMLNGGSFMEGVTGALPTGFYGSTNTQPYVANFLSGSSGPSAAASGTPTSAAEITPTNQMDTKSSLSGFGGGSSPSTPSAAPPSAGGISSLTQPVTDWISKHPYWTIAGAGLAGMALSDYMTPEQQEAAGLPPGATPEQIAAARFPAGTFTVRKASPVELTPTFSPAYAAAGGEIDARGGGHLKGPGTGTSDSIPAKLSDGEFVMTAKAVRGAGGGDRTEGARRMYELMHKFEKRA